MLAPPAPWTAVIPLRGGSKGLPGKNTRLLAGKPLYQHAIETARAAGAQNIILTTDIASVLERNHGQDVKVMHRPAHLCGDDIPMAPVLAHALEAEHINGVVLLLQATSPLRQPQDVLAALGMLSLHQYELVMSVILADNSVLKWGQLQAGKFIPLSLPEHCFSNRQSLPEVYRPNGAIYAMQAQWFLKHQSFASQHIGALHMPIERSIDVDTLADFERCEALLAALIPA